LADRSVRLKVCEIGGPLAEAELPDAGSNRPRRDQDDLLPLPADAVNLVGEAPDAVAVELPGRAGQDVGPDLQNDGVRLGNDPLADRIGHDPSLQENADSSLVQRVATGHNGNPPGTGVTACNVL
jgi:hypothetical protein